MLINNIIAFITVASLAVCGNARRFIPYNNEFVLSKFVGRWYEIAVMGHKILPSPCEWFDVTRREHGTECFDEVYHTGRERPTVYQIRGSIANSELSATYQIYRKDYDMVYTVTSFDRGATLVLIEKGNQQDNQLISRSDTASPQAITYFEQLASITGLNITYIDHVNCSYVALLDNQANL